MNKSNEQSPKRPGCLRRAFLFLGVVLVVAVPVGIELYLRRPVGEGPAGPAVAVGAFSSPWTQQKVHVQGIGDSVTRGLGAKSKSHTFFNRVLQNPPDEFPGMKGACLSAVLPSLTHENLAVSGSTSLDHIEVIREQLQPQADDVFGIVLMTTGGNDLIHSYGRMPPKEGAMYEASFSQAEPWIKRFHDRLAEMFETISERFPGGCEIYIADIYDPTDGVGDGASMFLKPWPDGLQIHAAYNQAIRDVAQSRSNVTVVPMYETFLGHGSHCRQFWRSTYRPEDPHYWFYTNIEDPNDRGYDAIRRVFLNAIVENTQLWK